MAKTPLKADSSINHQVSAVPDTFQPPKRPWECRSSYAPNERKASHDKLMHYLEQGGGRTYTKTAEHFGISLPVISRIARNNQWAVRAAAYDEYQALYKADQERNRRHDEHKSKLESFRTRSEKVGEAMIAAAAQLLQQANMTIQEMKAHGETLDRKLLSSALQASARVAESGRLLMSQSLGVDALLSGIDGAEGDGEEYT